MNKVLQRPKTEMTLNQNSTKIDMYLYEPVRNVAQIGRVVLSLVGRVVCGMEGRQMFGGGWLRVENVEWELLTNKC